MTDQITVPRTTLDAMQRALKDIAEESYDKGAVEGAIHALTAANAVSVERQPLNRMAITDSLGLPPSAQNFAIIKATEEALSHPKPENALATDGVAITSKSDEADILTIAYLDGYQSGKKSVQPLGWYVLDKGNMATLCRDYEDALDTAASAFMAYPHNGPYRVIQLCEFNHTEQHLDMVQPQAQGEAVYLVATGETYNGEETYTRHDVMPPLCEAEKVYTRPQVTEPETESRKGWLRYEKLRKLTPTHFQEIHSRNIKGEFFDDMIDALPEPSTPKPWGNATEPAKQC